MLSGGSLGVEPGVCVLPTDAITLCLQAAMKAVVASSRLGNHGHHDCSRSRGGSQGSTEATAASEELEAFPAVPKMPINGASCRS